MLPSSTSTSPWPPNGVGCQPRSVLPSNSACHSPAALAAANGARALDFIKADVDVLAARALMAMDRDRIYSVRKAAAALASSGSDS